MKKAVAILLPCLLAVAAILLFANREDNPSAGAGPGQLEIQNVAPELSAQLSGARAYAHIEEILKFGPRPPASEGLARTIEYLETTLAGYGWKTERQTFKAATPDGPVDFTNLMARHESADPLPASLPWIVGGHIDSKILPEPFVGANDGGSSTGILLDMARVLSTDPKSASKIEIVFFDGEEAFRPGITATDGLYGSKYFAHVMTTKRSSWPGGGIILDIVGDPDHDLLYSPEAPEHFVRTIESCAGRRSFTKPFRMSPFPILDDHVPLQNAGIPCLHVIGEFGRMSYWHTPDDTIDKVDAGMLEKVGRMTLDFLAEVPAPEAP
ncbi:M28 family peptidase [Haloferula sp. A504]|uniref:M28 family peptidase n=1 Tax=Haloferula sp. A504 TaxID=3373601 RepID=UPI0031CA7581|nr:M28 family peptidase [Verrucomicrobiaceae bacterium E54]